VYGSNGTCIQFFAQSLSALSLTDYSMGINTNDLWTNVPTTAAHTWRFNGSSAMSLLSTGLSIPGTLNVTGAATLGSLNVTKPIATASASSTTLSSTATGTFCMFIGAYNNNSYVIGRITVSLMNFANADSIIIQINAAGSSVPYVTINKDNAYNNGANGTGVRITQISITGTVASTSYHGIYVYYTCNDSSPTPLNGGVSFIDESAAIGTLPSTFVPACSNVASSTADSSGISPDAGYILYTNNGTAGGMTMPSSIQFDKKIGNPTSTSGLVNGSRLRLLTQSSAGPSLNDYAIGVGGNSDIWHNSLGGHSWYIGGNSAASVNSSGINTPNVVTGSGGFTSGIATGAVTAATSGTYCVALGSYGVAFIGRIIVNIGGSNNADSITIHVTTNASNAAPACRISKQTPYLPGSGLTITQVSITNVGTFNAVHGVYVYYAAGTASNTPLTCSVSSVVEFSNSPFTAAVSVVPSGTAINGQSPDGGFIIPVISGDTLDTSMLLVNPAGAAVQFPATAGAVGSVAGTKLQLFPSGGIAGGAPSVSDYAIGVSANTLWSNTASQFDWDVAGVRAMNLNSTGITAPGLSSTPGATNIAYLNTGNYIETSAGSGIAYLDLHNGTPTSNVDYDTRLYSNSGGLSVYFDSSATISTTKIFNVAASVFGNGVQLAPKEFIFGNVTASNVAVGSSVNSASIGQFTTKGTRVIVKVSGAIILLTPNPQLFGSVTVGPVLSAVIGGAQRTQGNAYTQFVPANQSSLKYQFNFHATGQFTGVPIGTAFNVLFTQIAQADSTMQTSYSFNAAEITHYDT
jgi:hypothetical protein